jgi:hypothetical protein
MHSKNSELRPQRNLVRLLILCTRSKCISHSWHIHLWDCLFQDSGGWYIVSKSYPPPPILTLLGRGMLPLGYRERSWVWDSKPSKALERSFIFQRIQENLVRLFTISGILRDLCDLQELFEHLFWSLQISDCRSSRFCSGCSEMATIAFPDLWSFMCAVFYDFLVPRSSRHIQFGL